MGFYRRLVDQVWVTARGGRRLLRAARTIAELEGAARDRHPLVRGDRVPAVRLRRARRSGP